jgi:hypothetical protein
VNFAKKNLFVILICLGVTLVGLGSKWNMIDKYGSSVHYQDAWSGDATQLIAYLEGNLTFKELFWAPHNEHRIGITRLLSIIITTINGQWDNKVKISLNAFLHIFFYILLICKYKSTLTKINLWMLPTLICFCLTCPSSFENTLNSFQIQFYVNLVTSFIIIHYLTKEILKKSEYCILLAIILISIFNMSSTIFPLISVGILTIYNYIREKKFKKQIVRNSLIISPFVFFSFYAINHIEAHEELHAKSIFYFIQMLSECLAFPFGSKSIILNIIILFFLNLPIIIFLFNFLYNKLNYTNKNNCQFTLCLIICILLQIIGLCYARNSYPIPSRYYDILIILVISNCICIEHLYSNFISFRKQKIKNFIILWFVILSLGFSKRLITTDLNSVGDYRENIEYHLKKYTTDGNRSKYLKLPLSVIPYPHPIPILNVMENKLLKEYLPPPIGGKIIVENENLKKSKSIDNKQLNKIECRDYYILENENNIFNSDLLRYESGPNILRLCFKGDPQLNTKCVKLINQNGFESFLSTKNFTGDWETGHFFLPENTKSLRLSINLDSKKSWFMFQDPEKITPTSWILRQARKSSINILLCGIFVLSVSIILTNKENKFCATEPKTTEDI